MSRNLCRYSIRWTLRWGKLQLNTYTRHFRITTYAWKDGIGSVKESNFDFIGLLLKTGQRPRPGHPLESSIQTLSQTHFMVLWHSSVFSHTYRRSYRQIRRGPNPKHHKVTCHCWRMQFSVAMISWAVLVHTILRLRRDLRLWLSY